METIFPILPQTHGFCFKFGSKLETNDLSGSVWCNEPRAFLFFGRTIDSLLQATSSLIRNNSLLAGAFQAMDRT